MQNRVQTIRAGTRYRPPYSPVTLGTFAGLNRGELFRTRRLLPAHESHLALGAKIEEYGTWMRPAYYPRDNETENKAIRREVLAVRTGVGIFDATPLGKIEVKGRDAAEFLNRIYINEMAKLKVGGARYGLMLNEYGAIIDDGVTLRLAEDDFPVGTASAQAIGIAEHLEEWLQCEWADLRVVTLPVSNSWGVVTLDGPKARDVLAGLGPDIDLSPAAFPHMTFRCGKLAEVPCRIARVSYSGELSFELSVPTGYFRAVWDLAMEAGRAHDITPFGIQSLDVLRIEKGFLHVGADTDATTIPGDVGWGEVALKKTVNFVGKRSLSLPASCQPQRLQLVGVVSADPRQTIRHGARIFLEQDAKQSAGFITSACHSPTLGRAVALAMLAAGQSRLGATIWLSGEGSLRQEAVVVRPAFYDPEGAHLHG